MPNDVSVPRIVTQIVPSHTHDQQSGDHDHTGHAHVHDHSHRGHSHAPASFGRALAIGTTLNVGFVIVETIFGLRANSVALLADAGHNLSDVLGLLIAWGASILATRGPTARRTGAYWLDPLSSLGIALIIIAGTWSLLRDSANLALHAVPTQIDFNKADACLRELPGVTDVHDLHIWAISTTDVALTAHLVYPTGDDHDELLRSACDTLTNRFGIGHATLQVERGSDALACHFASGNVI